MKHRRLRRIRRMRSSTRIVYVVGKKVHKSLKKAIRHARRIGAKKIIKYTLRPRRR